MKTIFSVGRPVPSEDCHYLTFDSDRSLADADIILYWPTLGGAQSYESYGGKRLLTEHWSSRLNQYIDHWHSELLAAVQAGKLVVVFLAPLDEAYYYTGRQEHSGTGRSRVTTNMVSLTTNYKAVPGLTSVVPKTGERIRTTRHSALIAGYWHEFADLSVYRVVVTGKFTRVLLETRGGENIVGALSLYQSGGGILYLPYLDFDIGSMRKKNSLEWRVDALRFGGRLLTAIVNIFNGLRSDAGSTPPPGWVQDGAYVLAQEQRVLADIEVNQKKLATIEAKIKQLHTELEGSRGLKRLLYEQGRLLEGAVREALLLLGFTVGTYQDGSSEFDAVFQSEEGRFLGEIEGKDNRPINIDKLSQLERNLQEDYAREEVDSFAKGVLFGNAYRLTKPEERQESFTAKCFEAAKRTRIALVRTQDLFEPARYLQEHEDKDYARACRLAIFRAEGAVVAFPPVPQTRASSENSQENAVN